jgi:hypothetical protein
MNKRKERLEHMKRQKSGLVDEFGYEALEDLSNWTIDMIAEIPYDRVLFFHIAIFGETLAREGMNIGKKDKEFVYESDYLMHLISNDSFRWLIDRFMKSNDFFENDVTALLEVLNREYNNYLEWVEAKQIIKQRGSLE